MILATQSNAQTAAKNDVLFRRDFVPQERVDMLDKGCLPMKREEFERLVKKVQETVASPETAAARLVEGDYTATFEDGVLRGEATLHIVHEADEIILMPLSPLKAAISSPSWGLEPPRPAAIGLGSDGQILTVVEQSAPLRFDWSLRAEEESEGEWTFLLKMPPCATSRLTLHAPAGHKVEAARGVASRLDDAGKWQIELGGDGEAQVRVLEDSLQRPRRRTAFYRQVDAYAFSLQGVDLSVDLTIDVDDEPLRRLDLEVDAGLELAAASIGGQQVDWLVKAPATKGDGEEAAPRLVEIKFPQPIIGRGHKVRLIAVGTFPLEEAWRLPRIRPSGPLWLQGSMALRMVDPLQLKDLKSKGHRLTGVAPLPAPRAGESIEFQQFDSQSWFDVSIGRKAAPVNLHTGLTISLDESGATATSVNRFTTSSAQRFVLSANVGAGWSIDDVKIASDGQSADLLEDWSVSGAGRARTLVVRLGKPLTADRAVTLAIDARRGSPPRGNWSGEHFELASFADIGQHRRLVAVRARPPQQLRIRRDADVQWLDPRKLSQPDAALLSASEESYVFVDDGAFTAASVSVVDEDARYRSEIAVAADLDQDVLSETYTITCVPETSHVERLSVHFSQKRSSSLVWRLVGEGEGDVAAVRRVSDEPDVPGETWEVALPRPLSEPFTLRAHRQTEAKGPFQIALASVSEAISQAGTLSIFSPESIDTRLSARGVTPVPARSSGFSRTNDLRAAYRYQPQQDASCTVQAVKDEARTKVWAWSAKYVSRFPEQGPRSHAATFRLENIGADETTIHLPPNLRVTSVRVNSVAQPMRNQGDGDPLVVPLPRGERFPTVEIVYESPAQKLHAVDEISAPLPRLDAPVLRRQWTAWLAPTFVETDSLTESDAPWTQQVAKRLWGPFYRPTSEEPVNFFSPQQWVERLTRRQKSPPWQEACRETLASLGGEGLSPFEAPTWKTLLQGHARRSEQLSIETPLWVDAEALANAEVTVDTPTTIDVHATKLEQGDARLGDAALALVATSDALLLTSAAQAASHRRLLKKTSFDNVFQTDQFWQTGDHWLPPDVWAADSSLDVNEHFAAAESLWSASNEHQGFAMRQKGWSAVVVDELPDTPVVRLGVHRPRVLIAAAVAALLAAWAILGCLGFRWAAALAMGIAAACALAAPAPYAGLCTGAFFGAALAAVFQTRRRQSRVVESPQEPAGSETTVTHNALQQVNSISFWLAAAVGAAAASLAVAQEPTDDDKAQSPQIVDESNAPVVHRVIVPVDDQRQVTGEYVYVPRPLFNVLHRQAIQTAAAPQAWLIRSAIYRGALAWSTETSDLELLELAATFDVEALQADAELELPFRRDQVLLLDDADWDGRRTPVRWKEDGESLAVTAPSAGRFRLTLRFRPQVARHGDDWGFDLNIPSLPRSRLTLNTPAGATGLRCPTAMGAASFNTQTSVFTAEVGAATKLQARWPALAAGVGGNLAEQLVWMKVGPGSVIAETRLRLFPVASPIRELRLKIDSDLRLERQLLPANWRAEEDPIDRGVVRLIFDQPVDQEQTIALSFLVRGRSKVGRLRLPRIEPLGIRLVRDWVGVSADDTLELDARLPQGGAEVSPTEFAAHFDADGPPQLAMRRPGAGGWTFAVRPQISPRACALSHAVTFGHGQVRVDFRADYESDDQPQAPEFVHRFGMPPNFEIDQVEVIRGGDVKPARWARSSDKKILTVFNDAKDAAVTGVRVLASTPLNNRPRFNMPLFAAIGADVSQSIVRVYRRQDVLIQVIKKTGLTDRDDAADAKVPGAVLVADWKEEETSRRPAATFAIDVNRPRFDGRMVTTMIEKNDQWLAEVDCLVSVGEGLADALQFEISDNFAAPFSVDPPASLEVNETPGRRRQMIVRPEQPIGGRARFKIRGVVQTPFGERVRAPEVTLVGSRAMNRYFVAPVFWQGQSIGWDTPGLRPGQLPEDLHANAERMVVYQAVANRFQAVLKRIDPDSVDPQVHLANIRYRCGHADRCFGVAAFSLAPAGLRHVDLVMPPGGRLLEATVEGRPAVMRKLPGGQWRLMLSSDHLPQRIEALFTVERSHEAASLLRAPMLDGLPVSRTLWSIGPADFWSSRRAKAAQDQVNAGRHAALQLQSTATLMDVARRASDSTSEELSQWHGPWARRAMRLRQSIQLGEPFGAEESIDDDADFNLIDDEQAHLASIWSLPDVSAVSASAEELRQLSHVELFHFVSGSWRPSRHFAFSGEVEKLEWSHLPSKHSSRWMLWVSSAACLLMGAIAGVCLSRPRVAEWLMENEAAIIAAAGLAWWIWLSPSIVGWLIVAAAVVRGWRA